MDKLKANIIPKGTLQATIISKENLQATISIAKKTGATTYKGPYQVIPKISKQTLPTSQRLLEKDIEVLDIPYDEVTNPQGGTTVTIGG